jgi:hypothetical protein
MYYSLWFSDVHVKFYHCVRGIKLLAWYEKAVSNTTGSKTIDYSHYEGEKPSFGFVGRLFIQEYYRTFERSTASYSYPLILTWPLRRSACRQVACEPSSVARITLLCKGDTGSSTKKRVAIVIHGEASTCTAIYWVRELWDPLKCPHAVCTR